MTARRFAAALTAALSFMALAACGSASPNHTRDQGLEQKLGRDRAKAAVAKAEVQLARAVVVGDEWVVFAKTQTVISAIRRARTVDVPSAWIEKQINFSESDVEIVPCHDCFTALEAARS